MPPSEPSPSSGSGSAFLLCCIAAVIFLGCAVLFWFAPTEIPVAVRAVVSGFNAILAVAVFLYGRHLKSEG
ncbi:MAG: hypothetical protein EAZ36_04765 [Verrucomicrobia bacterium]|nr:MAG: hypothetical protein EAZ36_04765 [Verrucomicrobiota bacterium]